MRRRLIADAKQRGGRQQKTIVVLAAEARIKTNLSWQLISQEMTPTDRGAFSILSIWHSRLAESE